jgi:hypothetical protein
VVRPKFEPRTPPPQVQVWSVTATRIRWLRNKYYVRETYIYIERILEKLMPNASSTKWNMSTTQFTVETFLYDMWPCKLDSRLEIIYYSVQARYWITTSKQTTKQHPLLGSRFLTSKYTQPLLSNAFANKLVPMERIGVQQWTVFSTGSVPNLYKDGNTSKSSERVVRESVKRGTSRSSKQQNERGSWRISTVRSRYQWTTCEDTADWEGLVYDVVICLTWKWAMAL